MNRALIIFCCCTIVFITNSYSQNDTTWNTYVTLGFSSDKTPNTITTYNTKRVEVMLKKGNHTIIPRVIQRSIFDLLGYQYGLSYYKKFDWGYSHAEIQYSQSSILPHLSFRTDLFYTLSKGFVLNGGYYRFSYKHGVNASIVNIGATMYYKSTMSTFTVKVSNTGNPQYIGTMRKYLKNEIDYFQIRFTNAFEQGLIIGDTNSTSRIYSYQFGATKTIAKKLQLQLSFGISNAKLIETTNTFFNYSIGLKGQL